MKNTEDYKDAIIEIVDLVSMDFLDEDTEKEIGIYEEHFFTDRMSYLVRLHTNDRLEIPMEAAQDYAKTGSLLPGQLETIKTSYRRE